MAPTSFEDLQNLLKDDIKVKVAGTTFVGSRAYLISSHFRYLGIDGEQAPELLQILHLMRLACSGWRSSREIHGASLPSAYLYRVTNNIEQSKDKFLHSVKLDGFGFCSVILQVNFSSNCISSAIIKLCDLF